MTYYIICNTSNATSSSGISYPRSHLIFSCLIQFSVHLFVILRFVVVVFCPLHYMSLFDLRLLTNPMLSSNFSQFPCYTSHVCINVSISTILRLECPHGVRLHFHTMYVHAKLVYTYFYHSKINKCGNKTSTLVVFPNC